MNEQLRARFERAREQATGRWTGLLQALGVAETVLNRRNQPCPLAGCGGTDRFQYTDKYGDGNYVCRACGAGGGFKLLMGYFGWNATTALRHVEVWLGMVQLAAPIPPPARETARMLRRLLAESQPVAAGDHVDRYLCGRGLGMACYPQALRCHPSLAYYERDAANGKPVLVGRYAAMVARVQDRHGATVSLHRTYLEQGAKVQGRNAKKLLGDGMQGGAIRLAPAGEELAVCEGIETGLAIFKRTGQPVWIGICAGNLERLWIPEQVRHLRIYGDNDADAMFDGQAAAYGLARSFMKERQRSINRRAEVFIPRAGGADWADVLTQHAAPVMQAA
ncbi:DUF7146 domain-containing protein [Pseudoduganella violacea]|uniref:Putative DNA primase/helicase n=1 Tax=Pseudoduganella violacea TaxID=1715466 RepID=A0A7W5FWS6_9BURK|nr:toprim domain-containing protein [Pseudoduganella violacea]MBB3122194.1 putative DNA primase/helicase [Pseudoduganella violacea]